MLNWNSFSQTNKIDSYKRNRGKLTPKGFFLYDYQYLHIPYFLFITAEGVRPQH